MPTRIPKWLNRHPNLFAFLLILAVFVWTVGRFEGVVDRLDEEAKQRRTAFCGLVFLFDESIRLSGGIQVPELKPAYEQWRRSVNTIECERFFVPPSTTTTEAP